MAEAISSVKLQKSTEGSSRSNRKKGKKDRISSLPDALLCHMLSFLPTKYSVRTSILSTRWRYLWTSVPVLHFVQGFATLDSGEDERVFMNSVDRVLFFNTVQSIKKFYLKCSWNYDFSRVNTWICVAIMRNVVELDLYLNSIGLDSDELQLPQNLFRCEKLKVLKLTSDLNSRELIVLNVPNSLSLPSLKVHHLRYVQGLNDASLSKFLSGSPVLEELEIARHEDDSMWTLHVKSCLLKRLSIKNDGGLIERSYGGKVVVDAPNLEFLEVKDYITGEFNITKLSLIVEARIEVYLEELGGEDLLDYANIVVQLLRQISNVKLLWLSSRVLKTLYEGTKEGLPALHNLITFLNLTHLEVKVEWLSFIPFDILKFMPYVKVIILDLEDEDESSWVRSETVPKCLLSCLVMVQFKNFLGSAVEMEIIEYFLENAMVLEKMTLSCHNHNRSTDPEVLKKLLSFPRASSSCQILFT